jgi:hypothetical protein
MTKEILITMRRHLVGALAEVEKALTEAIREENNKIVKVIDK